MKSHVSSKSFAVLYAVVLAALLMAASPLFVPAQAAADQPAVPAVAQTATDGPDAPDAPDATDGPDAAQASPAAAAQPSAPSAAQAASGQLAITSTSATTVRPQVSVQPQSASYTSTQTGTFSNGEQSVTLAFSYSNGSIVYRLNVTNLQTGTTRTVKALKVSMKSVNTTWSLSSVYGNTAFLCYSSGKTWKEDTYAINLTTGKKTLAAKNCGRALAANGKYVVARNAKRTDVSGVKTSLYKVSGTKLKKVRTLTKQGLMAKIIGNKVYFTSSSRNSLKDMSVYRCTVNGKSKKRLGGPWKSKAQYGQTAVYLVDSRTCLVQTAGKSYKFNYYRYTYKTKKLKRISYSEFLSLARAAG